MYQNETKFLRCFGEFISRVAVRQFLKKIVVFSYRKICLIYSNDEYFYKLALILPPKSSIKDVYLAQCVYFRLTKQKIILFLFIYFIYTLNNDAINTTKYIQKFYNLMMFLYRLIAYFT